MDVAHGVGERRGEDAEPRPHLEHDVLGVQVGEAEGDADEVVIDQEVLPEPRVGRDAEFRETCERDLPRRVHARLNARAAFDSTRSARAAGATPRRLAAQ